jgi:hypothetical protein
MNPDANAGKALEGKRFVICLCIMAIVIATTG